MVATPQRLQRVFPLTNKIDHGFSAHWSRFGFGHLAVSKDTIFAHHRFRRFCLNLAAPSSDRKWLELDARHPALCDFLVTQ
jgi:hypothetical protein